MKKKLGRIIAMIEAANVKKIHPSLIVCHSCPINAPQPPKVEYFFKKKSDEQNEQIEKYSIYYKNQDSEEVILKKRKKYREKLAILLYHLEKEKNYFNLQEAFELISKGTTKDLQGFRDKFIKLQNDLSFYLQTQSQQYTEHVFEIMFKLLRLLTQVINTKAN